MQVPLRMLSALALASLLTVACGDKSEQQVVAAAQSEIRAGDVPAAIIELKAYLADQPDASVPRAMLGEALLQRGDVPGAQVELERALAAGAPPERVLPPLARALLQQRKINELVALASGPPLTAASAAADLAVSLAQGQQSVGNVDAAMAAIADALRAVPDHPGALVMRTRLAAASGKTQEAVTDAKDLALRFPTNAEALLLKADALATVGDSGAEAAYREALALDKSLEAAHGALIQYALKQRDYQKARLQVDAMAAGVPGKVMPVYYDALVAYAAGDFARTREKTQLLLKMTTENAPLNLLAGMAEKRLGSLTLADALLSRALTVMPDNTELRRESAEVLVSLGQPRQALERLAPALTPATKDAMVWTVAARAHTLMADFGAADAALARARTLAPQDAGIRIEQARSMLARGNMEDGVRELQSVSEQEDGTQAMLDLVPALVRKKDYAGALAVVDRFAAKMPESALVDVVRGQVLQDSGNAAGARAAYESAQKRDPRFILAVERLAQLDLADNAYEAARKRYEAFLKKNPQSGPGYLALAEISRIEGQAPEAVHKVLDQAVAAAPLDPQTSLSAIEIGRRTGNLPLTLTRAQAAHAALPKDVDIMVQLALLLRESGELNQALRVLQTAAIARPDIARLRLLFADAAVAKQDLPSARSAVNRAMELAPGSIDVDRAHVRLLQLEGKPAEALKAAEQRRKRMPRDLDSVFLEADVRAATGPSRQTAALLQEALARDKETVLANRLSDELRRLGDTAAAVTFERQWMSTNPNDIGFMAYAAQQAATRGEVADATALYRKVIERQPDAALALNNLASLLLKDKPAEALELATRAVRLMPSSPALLDTFAQARAATGSMDGAIRAQKAALALDPQSVPLRLTLARLYIQAGDKADARELLSGLASRGDNLRESAEVTRLMKELGR